MPSSPAVPTRSDLKLVVLWMGGSLLSFSASALAVRALAPSLSIAEILAVRGALGLGLLGAAAALRPALRPGLRLRRPGLHLLRNVPHTLGQAGWSYGLTVLPLATVFALEFTAPVWLALLAVPILGERMTVPRAGALALGLAGVLIVLRPGAAPVDGASLAVLAAAFSFALTGVITKRLTATESTFSILFWMNAIQLPLFLLASDPAFPSRIAGARWWAVGALGLSGVLSHLSLTQAYRHGDATVVIPLDFLRIPLIALIGFAFFGETLDGYVFAGAAVIVAGILWNLRAEAARAAPAEITSGRTPG